MGTLVCSCNQTVPVDGVALGRALGETLPLHRELCRREVGAFQRAARQPGGLTVACTQERTLFEQLAEQTEGVPPRAERPIRFVNIREAAGWSREGARATPKMAALLAAARLPEPEPVPTVRYVSRGRLLIVGPAERAEALAQELAGVLEVSLLPTGGALRQQRQWPVLGGRLRSLRGWLGAFVAVREVDNPIDRNLCTRCNACVAACPEGAIGLDYQVDLSRCASHRACVKACEAVGAIDFGRAPQTQEDAFDLVLDLREAPAFTQHQPPQGYWHLPARVDALSTARVLLALREAVGTFEKPKFFNHKPSICAHARNQMVGCEACVQVCSASAITSEPKQQRIVVNPHLCAGCGACTTVCPTGALTYAYPDVPTLGQRIKTLLHTYAKAGGKDAVLLLHAAEAGGELLDELARAAVLELGVQGLPARVIPLPLWHVAAVGLEAWLAALACGASQVWVLLTADVAPQYQEALQTQTAVGQAIVSGLGYEGEHLRLLSVRDARDLAQLDAWLQAPAAQTVARPAAFAWQADKRATLELALQVLTEQAPLAGRAAAATDIALPAGAALGTVELDAQRCTLCMSCVGACPAAALQDDRETPRLRFVEKNCVQCGLCVKTCPENALALRPRLWLDEERRRPRVLHQAQPFRCVRCQKPFGTVQAVEAMVARLSGHAMFQGAARQRLMMCADCRVVDLFSAEDEVRVQDL